MDNRIVGQDSAGNGGVAGVTGEALHVSPLIGNALPLSTRIATAVGAAPQRITFSAALGITHLNCLAQLDNGATAASPGAFGLFVVNATSTAAAAALLNGGVLQASLSADYPVIAVPLDTFMEDIVVLNDGIIETIDVVAGYPSGGTVTPLSYVFWGQ